MVLGVHYYKSRNYSLVKEHSVNDALTLFLVYDVLALVCGLCEKYCGSRAIVLDPWPVFSDACCGCWGCYSICPEEAITTFLGTRGRYATGSAYLDAAATGNENS